MLVSILRSKTRAALRDILFCNFKLVIFLGRKGLRWMKFKFASVRFFADRRPTLYQSKGKIKLERYFQKKSLERLETFIIQEKGIYLFLYSCIY